MEFDQGVVLLNFHDRLEEITQLMRQWKINALKFRKYIFFNLVKGCTTLRRMTLLLLIYFVEKAFCRSVILSNVHFVETCFVKCFQRNINAHPVVKE